jgi:hypothetical protein
VTIFPQSAGRRLGAGTVIAFMLLVASAAAANAAAPQPVTIDSDMYVGGPGANTGTFERTSGSSLICASGTVEDTRYVFGTHFTGNGGNPNGVPLQVDKTFHCSDGDVFMRLEIKGVFADEYFYWTVLGGSGAYAGLRGGGDGTTDSLGNGHNINHYEGVLNR